MRVKSFRLDLRGLSGSTRNDRINDAVAEYVAGFRWAEDCAYHRSGSHFKRGTVVLVPPSHQDEGAFKHLGWRCPTRKRVRSAEWRCFIPHYSTRIEQVMPLIDVDGLGFSATRWVSVQHWDVEIHSVALPGVVADANTLPLAACLALLKSRGVEVVL